jgi:phenylacetate-CoA ligase
MPASLGEKLYYRLPIALQNVLFSLHGLRNTRRRYTKRFHTNLAWLKESEWWNEDQVREYQNEKLRELVHHAYSTVPFYKTFWDRHGVNPSQIEGLDDLGLLPILTKKLARHNQKQLLSRAFTRFNLIRGLSSGTSGSPIEVFSSRAGLALQWAIWWRHKARFGLGLKDKSLMFGARVPVDQGQHDPPFWRRDAFGHRVYLSTYHIKEANLTAIVDLLNSETFDYYTGYPSAMVSLAALIERHGIQLQRQPRYIVTGSDALLPVFEQTLKRVFRAPVTELYGMTEFAGNMSKCEHGSFHLDFECCALEERRLPGEQGGLHNLLFTGWGNLAMPFIRYEVGDYGRPMEGTCRCGRKTRAFVTIDGRTEDYIMTPDGRSLIGMNQVLEYAPGADEMQIYQPDVHQIEVRVVPNAAFSEHDKTAMLREFRRRLGAEIQIKFCLVDSIPRAASGKFRAVVSDVSGRTSEGLELHAAVATTSGTSRAASA